MKKNILKINNLRAEVNTGKEILKGLNIEINSGEIHVIMGPNGAGKSTLGNVLMGHPNYNVIDGQIEFDGEIINDIPVDERAKKGLFLSFQYPEEIPGVTVENFVRTSKNSVTGINSSIFKFKKELNKNMEELNMNAEYANRYLNVGFSGGEKKKNEILQMSILSPKLAVLDETDSGLDVDAIKVIYERVGNLVNDNNAVLVITHYNKILEYLKPDYVHILIDGKIVKTGGIELAQKIEKSGYEDIKKEYISA
jgi:Fe-S cluster assembly ATP-binding protein